MVQGFFHDIVANSDDILPEGMNNRIVPRIWRGLAMGYFVLLVISICFAGLLYLIAAKRGSNKTFWTIMGFVFGPFAIPFVFFAKKVDPKNTV